MESKGFKRKQSDSGDEKDRSAKELKRDLSKDAFDAKIKNNLSKWILDSKEVYNNLSDIAESLKIHYEYFGYYVSYQEKANNEVSYTSSEKKYKIGEIILKMRECNKLRSNITDNLENWNRIQRGNAWNQVEQYKNSVSSFFKNDIRKTIFAFYQRGSTEYTTLIGAIPHSLSSQREVKEGIDKLNKQVRDIHQAVQENSYLLYSLESKKVRKEVFEILKRLRHCIDGASILKEKGNLAGDHSGGYLWVLNKEAHITLETDSSSTAVDQSPSTLEEQVATLDIRDHPSGGRTEIKTIENQESNSWKEIKDLRLIEAIRSLLPEEHRGKEISGVWNETDAIITDKGFIGLKRVPDCFYNINVKKIYIIEKLTKSSLHRERAKGYFTGIKAKGMNSAPYQYLGPLGGNHQSSTASPKTSMQTGASLFTTTSTKGPYSDPNPIGMGSNEEAGSKSEGAQFEPKYFAGKHHQLADDENLARVEEDVNMSNTGYKSIAIDEVFIQTETTPQKKYEINVKQDNIVNESDGIKLILENIKLKMNEKNGNNYNIRYYEIGYMRSRINGKKGKPTSAVLMIKSAFAALMVMCKGQLNQKIHDNIEEEAALFSTEKEKLGAIAIVLKEVSQHNYEIPMKMKEALIKSIAPMNSEDFLAKYLPHIDSVGEWFKQQ